MGLGQPRSKSDLWKLVSIGEGDNVLERHDEGVQRQGRYPHNDAFLYHEFASLPAGPDS